MPSAIWSVPSSAASVMRAARIRLDLVIRACVFDAECVGLRPATGRGPGLSGGSSWPLGSLWAWNIGYTGPPRLVLRTGRPRGTLWTGRAGLPVGSRDTHRADNSVQAVLARRTGVALVAFRALLTLRSREAARTLLAVVPSGPGRTQRGGGRVVHHLVGLGAQRARERAGGARLLHLLAEIYCRVGSRVGTAGLVQLAESEHG